MLLYSQAALMHYAFDDDAQCCVVFVKSVSRQEPSARFHTSVASAARAGEVTL